MKNMKIQNVNTHIIKVKKFIYASMVFSMTEYDDVPT